MTLTFEERQAVRLLISDHKRKRAQIGVPIEDGYCNFCDQEVVKPKACRQAKMFCNKSCSSRYYVLWGPRGVRAKREAAKRSTWNHAHNSVATPTESEVAA